MSSLIRKYQLRTCAFLILRFKYVLNTQLTCAALYSDVKYDTRVSIPDCRVPAFREVGVLKRAMDFSNLHQIFRSWEHVTTQRSNGATETQILTNHVRHGH